MQRRFLLTPVEPRGKLRTTGSVASFISRRAVIRRLLRTAEASAFIIIFPGVRHERTKGLPSTDGERGERSDISRRDNPLP